MNFSGRSPGYRGAAIRCPGCAETMSQHALEECEVDVCTSCGGIWVDWFDGEVRKVTGDALIAAPVVPPTDRPSRNEAIALGACPRCTRQLVSERYMLDGKSTGAELLRCEECMGSFVTKTSGEMLAALPPDETPPPSKMEGAEGVEMLEPMPWDRFIAALKKVLGLA